jgi:hypothetical protein
MKWTDNVIVAACVLLVPCTAFFAGRGLPTIHIAPNQRALNSFNNIQSTHILTAKVTNLISLKKE